MPKYEVIVWYTTTIEDHYDDFIEAKNSDEAEAKARVLVSKDCDVTEIVRVTSKKVKDA
jgi:predicted nuclease of predicted toxin-antitoxin system